MNVKPPTVTLNAGQQQNITASETNQSSFSAESTNVNIATVAPLNGTQNAFTVTGVATGQCTVKVMDGNGQVFNVQVTVN